MHEQVDVDSYCEWGVDYLKLDGCSGRAYPQVRKTQVGPEVGPTSAFSSCNPTRMHGPTNIYWAMQPHTLLAPAQHLLDQVSRRDRRVLEEARLPDGALRRELCRLGITREMKEAATDNVS